MLLAPLRSLVVASDVASRRRAFASSRSTGCLHWRSAVVPKRRPGR